MKDKLIAWIAQGQELWDSLPNPVKTIINVVVGAGIASAAVYLKSLNGGPVDISLLWAAFITGASTAFWRAINPLDALYGLGKTLKPEPPVTDVPTLEIPPGNGDGDAPVQDDSTDAPADPVGDHELPDDPDAQEGNGN